MDTERYKKRNSLNVENDREDKMNRRHRYHFFSIGKKTLHLCFSRSGGFLILGLILVTSGIVYAGQSSSKILIEPQGQVALYPPEKVRVTFVRPIIGVQKESLQGEKARECLKVQPFLDGKLRWDSSQELHYEFLDTPRPDTLYKVTLSCIPISDNQIEPISQVQTTFRTPPFRVVRVAAIQMKNVREGNRIVLTGKLTLVFNYPVESRILRDFVRIEGVEGEISRITSEAKKGVFTLTVRSEPTKSFRLVLQKGLPEAGGKARFNQDVIYTIQPPSAFATLLELRTEERGDMRWVSIRCETSIEKGCDLRAGDIKGFVSIEPQIPFRMMAGRYRLRIYAPFEPGKEYLLRFYAGMPTAPGVVTDRDYTFRIRFKEPPPRLRFVFQGRHLGRSGGARLPFEAKKIRSVKVQIYRIPPRNIVHGIRTMNSYYYSDITDYAEKVAQGELKVESPEKNMLFLELDRWMPTREPGIYIVRLNGAPYRKPQPWWRYSHFVEDESVLIISDIALVAKVKKGKIHVWAVHAVTLQPLKSVRIEAFSQKNVKLGECRTNRKGYCSIEYEPVRDRRTFLIMAKSRDDWTYAYIDENTLDISPFQTGGVPFPSQAVEGILYSERDLYRPGESVPLVALLWSWTSMRGATIPIQFKVINPRGTVVYDGRGIPDEFGLVSFTLTPNMTQLTGKYTVELMVGEKPIHSFSFFVETFVPQRLHVDIQLSKAFYFPGDKMEAEVRADYLYGAPAGGEEAVVWCGVEELDWKPDRYRRFRFNPSRERPIQKRSERKRVVLDDKGRLKFECKNLPFENLRVPSRLSFFAEVSEAGSARTTRAFKTVLYYPFSEYVGIQKVKTKDEDSHLFEGVVVDAHGNLVQKPGTVEVQVFERRWDWVREYDSSAGRFVWHSTYEDIPIQDRDIIRFENGRFQYRFIPLSSWETYRIQFRLLSGHTTDYVIRPWGWWPSKERAPAPDVLQLHFDKKEADFGSKVRVRTPIPFEGRILWVLEAGTLKKWEWKTAVGQESEWSFTVPKVQGTLYVSAFLVRSDARYTIQRAYGVGRIRVLPGKHHLQLKLIVPEMIKPRKQLNIRVEAGEPFEATIAIVDEGILQLTKYETPDPYLMIFPFRELLFDTIETFGWWIPKRNWRTGGGRGEKGGMVSPEFIKLVRHWSGVLRSDEQGVLKYTWEVPDYNGKLRVMVVGVNAEKWGAADADVIVREDVILQATFPRFLRYRDKARIPIFLSNTTEEELQGQFVVRSGSRVDTSAVVLPARGRKRVWVDIQAPTKGDKLTVEYQFITGGHVYSGSHDVVLLPHARPVKRVEFHSLKPSVKNEFILKKEWSYLKTVKLTFTHFVGLSFLKKAQELLAYPYGCVEQTSSKLVPLVTIYPVAKKLGFEGMDDAFVFNSVHDGIQRLRLMQTASGGFAFWPGGTDVEPWASAYATYVLQLAKESGFDVPETMLQSVLRYIKRESRTLSLGLFVLGRAGELGSWDVRYILRMLQGDSNLSFDDKVFLVGALFYAQGSGQAQPWFLKLVEAYKNSQVSHDTIYGSPLRDRALLTYLGLLLGEKEETQRLFDTLVFQILNKPRTLTTQEMAWLLLVLNEYVKNRQFTNESPSVSVSVDDRSVPCIQDKKALSCEVHGDVLDKVLVIMNRSEQPVYMSMEIEGIPSFGSEQWSQGKSAPGWVWMVEYQDMDGNPVNEFHLGQIYRIHLCMENRSVSYLQNIVLRDELPAGFEIENPRLFKDYVDTNRTVNTFTPEYIDIRDEEIRAYGTYWGSCKWYIFTVRAVTQGVFFDPPAFGEAMYDPSVWMFSPPRTIRIKE